MRPWSYSRLSTYEDCPKQYQYSYIENLPGYRPESPAASRGSQIHGECEEYLLGSRPIYPPSIQRVSAHAMGLKARKAKPELRLAVTESWEPTDYKAENTYFRGIIDVCYTEDDAVHIQDWKTGQIYDSHPKQMEVYVALAAAHFPEAKVFHTRLIYVDQGVVTPAKVTEAERVKPIRLLLDGRIKNAEEDEIFPVRTGSHCRWCDYSARYGGPCPH